MQTRVNKDFKGEMTHKWHVLGVQSQKTEKSIQTSRNVRAPRQQ